MVILNIPFKLTVLCFCLVYSSISMYASTCFSKALHLKTLQESGSLEAKYNELRGGSRPLHNTVCFETKSPK